MRAGTRCVCQAARGDCCDAQAGPPYELDPHSLRTAGSGPALLGGLLIDGVAPSSTNSYILDKVRPLSGLPEQAPQQGRCGSSAQGACSEPRCGALQGVITDLCRLTSHAVGNLALEKAGLCASVALHLSILDGNAQ